MLHKADQIPMHNSFAALGTEFYSRVKPSPLINNLHLVHLNPDTAKLIDLNIGQNNSSIIIDVFSGNKPISGSDSLAMLYAGHQFGGYVSQLGDGRAMIIGETKNSRNESWEIQLKGSGITPYSRDGDGRAVLRSTIREYLCSEAMHALGISTTRALCMIGSSDEVYRENIETGAILTRLAPSHIRFGSFEVFYYRNQFEPIKTLASYTIKNHFPDLEGHSNCYALWLDAVIDRTAEMIAHWQAVGFCHGVMNTDNMSILGLTLDYGPFGFMEAFDPNYICNHSDYQGRYSYAQQPKIGLFNLSCFAQAILPLLHTEPETAGKIATQLLETYQQRYTDYYTTLMRTKLGLLDISGYTEVSQNEPELISDLLSLMAKDRVDFTIFFRRLCHFNISQPEQNTSICDLFLHTDEFEHWLKRYNTRLQQQDDSDQARQARMKRVNPKYVLRNYMAEAAIRKAQDNNDYGEIDRLLTLLQNPFDEQPENESYAAFPPEWAQNISVSCSS